MAYNESRVKVPKFTQRAKEWVNGFDIIDESYTITVEDAIILVKQLQAGIERASAENIKLKEAERVRLRAELEALK